MVLHMKLTTQFSHKLFAIEQNVLNETYVVPTGISYSGYKSCLDSCRDEFRLCSNVI